MFYFLFLKVDLWKENTRWGNFQSAAERSESSNFQESVSSSSSESPLSLPPESMKYVIDLAVNTGMWETVADWARQLANGGTAISRRDDELQRESEFQPPVSLLVTLLVTWFTVQWTNWVNPENRSSGKMQSAIPTLENWSISWSSISWKTNWPFCFWGFCNQISRVFSIAIQKNKQTFVNHAV